MPIRPFFVARKTQGLLVLKGCGHLANARRIWQYRILLCRTGRRRPEQIGGTGLLTFSSPHSRCRVPNKGQGNKVTCSGTIRYLKFCHANPTGLHDESR
jgi:hypothetical protein